MYISHVCIYPMYVYIPCMYISHVCIYPIYMYISHLHVYIPSTCISYQHSMNMNMNIPSIIPCPMNMNILSIPHQSPINLHYTHSYIHQHSPIYSTLTHAYLLIYTPIHYINIPIHTYTPLFLTFLKLPLPLPLPLPNPLWLTSYLSNCLPNPSNSLPIQFLPKSPWHHIQSPSQIPVTSYPIAFLIPSDIISPVHYHYPPNLAGTVNPTVNDLLKTSFGM